jgi:hypothetical protein
VGQWVEQQSIRHSRKSFSVAEAIQKLFADAKVIGISSTGSTKTGSVDETVLDATVRHDVSLA